MASERKILMFEANEVPTRVLDHHIQKHPDSHLARILREAKQFETLCEDQIELDPWISWPTLHRGVIDQQHQILHLGQALEAANDTYPPVWELLKRAGKQVGVMGALHSSAVPANVQQYAFYVPDVFADTLFAHPASLIPFQAFNLTMTRKSTRNIDKQVPLSEALRFLLEYPRQGMSLLCLREIARVLLDERHASHLKTRRRALQPLVTLDLFLHFSRKMQTDFSVMHANHVAAAMHRYWAAAFPTDGLGGQMPPEWHAKYRDEVDFAMRRFDDMVGRLRAFVDADPRYKLVIASSLGQAGVETTPTPGFFAIRDLPRFMHALGVNDSRWKERFAMAPCVAVALDSAAEADMFEHKLRSIAVDAHRMRATPRELPPLAFDRKGTSFQLYIYFEAYEGKQRAQLGDAVLDFSVLGWGFHPHEDGVACSGRHTPNGMMLVYDPLQKTRSTERATISTLEIAPALLRELGVEVPAYMRGADPDLLDPDQAGTRRPLRVTGGGVETTVMRQAVGKS